MDGRVGLSLIDTGRIVATYRFVPAPGWTARDVAVAADNQARILLAAADGRMALWTVDNTGTVTNSEKVYEPPRSGETAVRVSAGSDGLTRVLWTGPNGAGHVQVMGTDNVLRSSFAFCGDFGQNTGCGAWDY
jgi:FAD/FMN-containing dehydrogenase